MIATKKNCLQGFQPGQTQKTYADTEAGWTLEISDIEIRLYYMYLGRKNVRISLHNKLINFCKKLGLS